MTVNFFIDRMKDGGHILEWEEGLFTFIMSESGNRKPILTATDHSIRYLTWSNWEIAL
jgi:hypothetical protein